MGSGIRAAFVAAPADRWVLPVACSGLRSHRHARRHGFAPAQDRQHYIESPHVSHRLGWDLAPGGSGFAGTYGSFGMSGSSIKLPGDYLVAYANGASLDENGRIQIDSDSFLQGGVLPDTRVPITEETLKAIYVENRDVLLETAIEALQSDSQTP